MLGVDRLATTTTIRQAYYDLEMMFNSFKERWPARHELNTKLDSLFARINKAYYTLSDLSKRRAYDMPGDKRSNVVQNAHNSNPQPARSPQAGSAALPINPPPVAQPILRTNPPVA